MVNDRNEKKRNAQKEKETVASTEFHRHGERSVHSLSDQRLKAYLEWDECLYVSLARLPRRIHSPFHFKCSAALFWVAALSLRPPRCTYHSFCPLPSHPFSLWALWLVIYRTCENFAGIKSFPIFIDLHNCDNELADSDLFLFLRSRVYNYYWNFLISIFPS